MEYQIIPQERILPTNSEIFYLLHFLLFPRSALRKLQQLPQLQVTGLPLIKFPSLIYYMLQTHARVAEQANGVRFFYICFARYIKFCPSLSFRYLFCLSSLGLLYKKYLFLPYPGFLCLLWLQYLGFALLDFSMF